MDLVEQSLKPQNPENPEVMWKRARWEKHRHSNSKNGFERYNT